jgi:indole-3-glycerol phosphate synthase
MRFSFAVLTTAVAITSVVLQTCSAFSPSTAFVSRWSASASASTFSTSSTLTSLNAIGVLARKAKEADIRSAIQAGIPDNVMALYKLIQENQDKEYIPAPPGPLQQVLTRRKGTITIIAEYKRKLDGQSGFVADIFDPEILSPTFREFGAAAIAVMADERMGGCTYKDLASFVEEQRRARNDVPGSVLVINNDLIVDELQVAQTAAIGVSAIVITLDVVGESKCLDLLKAAHAVGVEAIVAVSSNEQAQSAVQLGARIISVVNVQGVDDKVACVKDLGDGVTTIANILCNDNAQMMEIEEAWICRDKGFNVAWVSDALYKGSDSTEHPGAIIKSMAAKSSVKWASAKAKNGKGEGAREYLGDILM